MNNNTNLNQRRFLIILGLIVSILSVVTHFSTAKNVRHINTPGNTNEASPTPFDNVKQVDAGLLNVGYAEVGPANGQAVILLHGWPYDIHSYEDAAGLLAAKGYRVIVPHLRGHGTTRFLSDKTLRNGQQAAVALDIIALMDALKINKAIIGGFDWGARTANIIAALWPARCLAMVSVNGYLINNLERNKLPLPPRAEYGWWYQYYFATERGKAGYEANWYDFNKLLWKNISPKWTFSDAVYDRAAASFKNRDYPAIVIHNYRWRLSLAEGEKQYDAIEGKLAAAPKIAIPTVTLDGDSDGVVAATDGSGFAKMFTGKHVHHIVKGAGHNLPQEAPQAFADAIVEAAG